MAKKIYMSDSDVESLIVEFRKQLTSMKCFGNIDIKRTICRDDRECIVFVSPTAWIKMTTLVARFETEVQWHGLVRRVNESTFEIYDILVFPHEVTGATVTSDQEKYNAWINSLDDESFNHLRFHGHSHVNMGVFASTTDMKYRSDIIAQLPKPKDGEDTFYIFLIMNKKHAWSAEVYDLTNNAIYSTDETNLFVMVGEDMTTDEFYDGAKKLAVARTETNHSKKGTYGSYSGYSSKWKDTSKKKDEKKEEKEEKDAIDKYYGRYADVETYGYGGYTYEDYDDKYDGPNDPFYARSYI